MILTSDVYVPAVRWRQGEYQALYRLKEPVKDRVMPFITIPAIEFDFEAGKQKKTVHEHVEPFARRYSQKWGQRPAWIGVNESIVQLPMNNGSDIFAHVFAELRTLGSQAIPEIPIGASQNTIASVASVVRKDRRGVGITVQLEDLMRSNLDSRFQGLMHALGVQPSQTDLILNLGAPNFQPYEQFSSLLVARLCELQSLNLHRNLVLIGTAIPETFASIAKGTGELVRHDWLFFQVAFDAVRSVSRRPNYGDYTIVHPNFRAIDMRVIKPAGKLVYTTRNRWLVCKGGAFRDYPMQMHDHCAAIVSTGMFKGPAFSNGDEYIAKCAARQVGPSNQTRWKNVAINHHITHVVRDDLATLNGMS